MTHLQNPIFIVGVPRSGTTLVQCILSANSNTFSLPETHFFTALRVLKQTPDSYLSLIDLKEIKDIVTAHGKTDIPESLYQDIANHSDNKAIDLFEGLIELYRPKTDSDKQLRVIEKTPSHISSLNQIAKIYPTAKFIHIVRNPLGVINSLSKPPFESTRFFLARVRLWNNALKYVVEFEKDSASKIMTVRYEDIITNVEDVTKDMCSFLDLPFEKRMLSEFSEEFNKNINSNEYWKQNIKAGQILDQREKWRMRFSGGEAWFIEKTTKAFRQKYEYDSQAKASSIEILKTGISMGSLAVHHYGRKFTLKLQSYLK